MLALVADTVATLIAALFYGVPSLALLALVAGLGQSLAKVSLDATIQRDVHESIQASAFARSDTTLQLAWVIGGFVGIAMPLNPQLGLGVGCAVLAAWAIFVLRHPAATDECVAGAGDAGSVLELQLVGQRPQQLGDRLGGPRVGVPAVAVGLADAVEQPDQVLDDRAHLLGLLAPGRGLVARDRRGRVEEPDLQRLVAAAALGDAELDAGAGLQRGHALGERVGAHVDVGPVLL